MQQRTQGTDWQGGDMAVDGLAGDLAVRLGGVDGVVGVMLGGSRARGQHSAGSDHDLGLYYRPPLDTGALLALARAVSGARCGGDRAWRVGVRGSTGS